MGTRQVYGYGRPKDQEDKAKQKAALENYGCDSILMERVGKGKIANATLEKIIDQLREGDKLVVSSIYVFPFTLLKLIDLFDGLLQNGVEVLCLEEKLGNDPSYGILNAYHSRSRSERSKASLPEAGENTRRKRGITDETKQKYLAIITLRGQGMSIRAIKEEMEMGSTRMIYQAIEMYGDPLKKDKK